MADVKGLRSVQTEQRRRYRHKRKRTVTLGAVILLFAVLGISLVVFLIVKSAAGYVNSFLGSDETASYFDSYLEPVVMFDPDTFSNISKANPQWELETAIWAALDENEKNGRYASTSDGREILPIKDVASYLKKYFGGAVKPDYKTFSDGNFTYEFNKKEQCYYIPLTAVTNFYTPRVTKISRSFNTVTLTVQYIPGENWGEDSNGNVTQPAADKTMTIVLSGGRGDYMVKEIKNYKKADSSTKTLDSSGENSYDSRRSSSAS
jgi:hypothetical protein